MSDGSAEAVRDAVRAQLADPRAGGSVGTWGAVADIEHGRCEPVVLEGLSVRSRRAIANEHQKLPLFDLGVGTAYADFCVRTDRPPLIDALMVVHTARSTSSFRVRR